MFGFRFRAAHQPSGPRACRLIIRDGLFTGDIGGDIAFGALHDPAGTRWQIPHHLRQQQLKPAIIDQVDIGAIAWRDASPVPQAIKFSGIAGDHPHRAPQLNLWPRGAVPRPESESHCRAARITGDSAMRARIAQPKASGRVRHHLVYFVQGSAGVIGIRVQDQILPVVAE